MKRRTKLIKDRLCGLEIDVHQLIEELLGGGSMDAKTRKRLEGIKGGMEETAPHLIDEDDELYDEEDGA